jgi:hypothetical protein
MRITKYVLMSFVTVGLIACDEGSEKPQSISKEEAAVIMASSISMNSFGVASVLDESAGVSAEFAGNGAKVENCGVLQNISLSGSSPVDAVVKFSYDFSYKFQLNCDEEENPNWVTVNLSYSGMFDGPQLASEHTGASELQVDGLGSDHPNFLVDGYFNRSGSIETKGDEPKSVEGSVEILIDGVTIDKENHDLIEGTLTVDISGTVEGKGDYSYSGVLTFDGSSTANLKIGRTQFAINLTTGTVEGSD